VKTQVQKMSNDGKIKKVKESELCLGLFIRSELVSFNCLSGIVDINDPSINYYYQIAVGVYRVHFKEQR